MYTTIILLALGLTAIVAVPTNSPSKSQRIIGGSVTTIDQYPQMAALLVTDDGNVFFHTCGGTIINARSVLTAAHCPERTPKDRWRFRVGSTWANSGGVVHTLSGIIIHPNYNTWTMDSDIAIFRSASPIVYSDVVRRGQFAGINYNLGDNEIVWGTGWGDIAVGGPSSEQLRHVQVWTINQATCRSRYSQVRWTITDNMLCSGWLDVGGRDQCQGDSGGPLLHDGVVVGVCSFGQDCALARFPGVNTRVSRFSRWIEDNA